MKISINVDIFVPSWLKRSLILGVVPALILATVAIGRAGVPNTFADGETLSAQKLNDNFAALDARIATLEGAPAPQGPVFEGFSATAVNFGKPAGWEPIIASEVAFDTFGASYNVAAGTFSAPKDGYYRFSVGGHSPTSSSIPDSRIYFALTLNGTPQAVSGGQLSTTDTPLPSFSYIMKLAKGDQVGVRSFSDAAMTFGATKEYGFWFQGQFLGN
jgi:hypothetical protein